MAEEHDLSIVTGLEGYDSTYSPTEFIEYLKTDLLSEDYKYGLGFWRPERYQQSDENELYHDSNSTSYEREIKEKIKCVLKEIASHPIWFGQHLVQFWAPKVDGGHHYLTTSDQPFGVGYDLCKGFCWYRKQCMDHYCVSVEEGAKEEQVGAVGRVYQNKRPESSPDLRLYSTKEFPLRDFAARCGLRSYLALPVFDLLNNECYGVLELLSFDTADMENKFISLDRGLQVAGLRSTHINFFPISHYWGLMPSKYKQQPESEISKMLELAIKAIPQLHMAQIWVPCKQCAKMSNNLSCMERAAFINFEDGILNSCTNIGSDMFDYLQAYEFHNLQVDKGIARALMSSNSKSCFCRHLSDLSISENPLSHYAQKARLSLCFALCLESVHNRNDLYVVQFFLQSNCREDACGDSFLHLLLRIMEMELKTFKVALGAQLGEELVVDMSQPNAIEYKSIQCAQERKHQHSKELNMFMVVEQHRERYSESNFTKYLQTADLCCLRPTGMRLDGWVFCSPDRDELSENDVNSNSLLVPNPIKKKIKLLMNDIASKVFWDSYSLIQFWAPKVKENRRYLATSDQPFALGCLGKGLALFRKQCMKHHYFVDEGAKEEKLGPPGRVFRNGHPEITPDLCLYSTSEFPLRNHAAHCCLRKYFALPLFDLHQHECIGVLEFVEFSDFTLIGKALEAANLSSTHINFKPSFQASQVSSNIAERRKLALTEVEDALQLVSKIPQLYMAEVWVPYGECASINSNLSCMEMAFSTKSRRELRLPVSRIQHVQTRKGIAGMALASENKSCFCRSSCDFSIAEQPLAHYAQRARLDVCFAMCLQSSHTGNLLYVLEFFLNQGPAKYEYFLSFLYFLLSIMKQKLQSFKVASGQQIGEELVVEVIEFSEANKLTFSQLDLPDKFPLKFKIVQYGQKEHQHSKDQQVQCVSDGMDSVRSVAQARPRSTATNPKKEDAAKKTDRGKRKTGLHLNLEDLEPHFGKRLNDVAEELGVGRSTIKRTCRNYGIHRWPCNAKHKKNPSLFETKSVNEIAQDSQRNMCPSSSSNLLLSDMPLHENVPQTITESTQHLFVQPEAEKVIIKAKYEDVTIKFQLSLSSGMDKIVEEVARKLNLKMGSFRLKYLDEDNDEILLADDDDLQLCLKSLTAVGKTVIQLFVQLIYK